MAAGLRYERQVQDYLSHLWLTYIVSPWFEFGAGGEKSFCQPDGLLFNYEQKIIRIIEIKLKHSRQGWRQLRLLYQPVIARAYPNWKVEGIEVCKFFDPITKIPEKWKLLTHEQEEVPQNHLGVLILRRELQQ